MPDSGYTNLSFIMPAEGNRITDNDIRTGYLRITVDFSRYFPNESCIVNVKINGNTFNVNFTYRDARSHLLHIGHAGMSSLGLYQGDSIRVKLYENIYELEKIQ